MRCGLRISEPAASHSSFHEAGFGEVGHNEESIRYFQSALRDFARVYLYPALRAGLLSDVPSGLCYRAVSSGPSELYLNGERLALA